MIEFPCHCGNRLSVPTELAGDVIQCPECSRLNDVPNLSEVANMNEDGTLKMGPELPPLEDSPTRLASVTRAFTRSHTDANGEDIDLRNTFDDILDSGTDEQGVIALADEMKVEQPKYDPLTGELVRPLDVKPDDPQPAEPHPAMIPMADRVVPYSRNVERGPLSPRNLTMRLMEPVNLVVMFFILLVHVLVTPVNVMMAAGLFLVAPLWIMGMMFFVAHYGNVIDDLGPGDRDELPRPMRDFSLSDDIWRPFTNVMGTCLLCYGPAIFVLAKELPTTIAAALALAGMVFVPAVLLTLCTSGSSLNLRPDRLLGVMRVIGARYLFLLVVLVIAMASYYVGLWRLQVDAVLLFVPRSQATQFKSTITWWFEPWFAYPLLVLGVYLSHWFCASLGLVYRAHQPQFPWILQHHIATKLAERNRPSRQRNPNANSATVRAKMQQPLAPPRVPR